MKYFYILILSFIFQPLYSQKHPVFYAGLDLYRQGSFSDNYFGSFNVGVQLYQLKFFAPEIGYDYLTGSLPEREISKEPPSNLGFHDALFRQGFSSSVLTLNPKLKFGKDDAFLVISPKYHIGNALSKASYYTSEENNGTYRRKKYQEVKSQISFWSFAVGFEGIYISPHFWFGLTLEFTTLDLSNNWNELDFSEYEVKPDSPRTNTIGFGFRFYYDPFSLEND